MRTIIIILITTITLQAQLPDTIPSFNHLPKFKQDLNTRKEYPLENAWDEFGLMMKTTHNYIEHTRAEAIQISKKTEELGIKF